MKRTRRIEIIRYSRRVTVSQDVAPPADAAVITQPQVIDVAPGAREATPPAAGAQDKGSDVTGDMAHEARRRRTAFRLRDLLRPRR